MMVIRREQMEAFREYMRQRFEVRMVQHIDSNYPEIYGDIDDRDKRMEEIEKLVRHGIEKASEYDITVENDVCLFVELMAQFGLDFDNREDLTWVQTILNDEGLTGTQKIDRIYEYLPEMSNTS